MRFTFPASPPPRLPASSPTPGLSLLLLGLALFLPIGEAHAAAEARRVDVGGYFRVMARPDLQGGNGRLGYWNLYGRLLNEGPWAALELRIRLLESRPGAAEPWARIHFKLEGGAVANAETSNGKFGEYRLSQLYAEAGNVLLPNVTWRIGTLDHWFGDLGLYDMKPGQIFFETLGLSAKLNAGPAEWVVGAGDSGFFVRGLEYSPILTFGTTLRLSAGRHFEVGVGGQLQYEPKVDGNRFAPHVTPDANYADWLRGEIVETFVAEHPGREDEFPNPEGASSVSGKAIGYLGFGNLGPLRWNSTYASFVHLHPDNFTTEEFGGEEYTIYVRDLTDRRFSFFLGNEANFEVVPNRFDVVWGLLYGDHWDEDNDISPSDDDRWYFSTVLRLQAYLSPTFHVLVEGSFAREVSRNGHAYRNHGDSIFENTDGVSDSRGLEYGDSAERWTGQAKAGVVLNPMGPGVYTRPSLRILYGLQYSTQNQAWGNSFVQTLSQQNEFGVYESHLHHVIAIEAEAWF